MDKFKSDTIKGPRGGKQWVCNECGCTFGAGKGALDHIDPVIPVDRPARTMSWDEIIDRMFFSPDENHQALCKTCHDIKSKEENALRRKLKKEAYETMEQGRSKR